MISKKLLRKLSPNNIYLIYDSIYTYVLKKHEDGGFHINILGNRDDMYIYEKDLEHLILEARGYDNGDLEWHYKNEYKYNGYTNKYKAIAGVGMLTIHQDFYGFSGLSFFGSYENEDTVKELNKFKKIMKSSNTKTKK